MVFSIRLHHFNYDFKVGYLWEDIVNIYCF